MSYPADINFRETNKNSRRIILLKKSQMTYSKFEYKKKK